MSGNLRDALENLVEDWAGKPSSYLRETAGLLRELLAAHPVEPAPVASRERVAEVLRAHKVGAFAGSDTACACDRTWRTNVAHREHVLDALLAAGVFREPEPVDREAVMRMLGNEGVGSYALKTDHALKEHREQVCAAVLALIGGDAK